MHDLGVRIVQDHKILLPHPHKILCKASTEKKKFGDYAFGMDYDAYCKLSPDTYIIHVDVRTKTIGGAPVWQLMENDGQFPIIEPTHKVGRCIYWSSHTLTTLARLTEVEVEEILKLRERRRSPNQTNLFI
jgi:hypothetical protein